MTELGPASERAIRSRANWLRTTVSECGLIPIASLVVLLAGALIQHFSSLPRSYSWLEPFNVMMNAYGVADFPAVVVGVLAIGLIARSGEWNVDALAAALSRPITTGAIARTAVRLSVGAAVAWADSFFFEDHTWLDVCAITILVAVLLTRPRSHFEPWKVVAGQLLVGMFSFCVISYTFTVIKASLFIGVAPKDAWIIHAETWLFGEPIHRVVARFASTHFHFLDWCDWAYFRFFNHMWATTLFLTAIRLHRERTECFGALVATYVIGGPLYHLLPAYGPLFHEPALYTYLQHIPIETNSVASLLLINTDAVSRGTSAKLWTWAYIACFPSLHIAQEIVMLWYARHSKLAIVLASAFSGLTFLAVMALGWHYFLDCLGGLVIAVIAIALAHRWRDWLMPLRFAGRPDEPLPSKMLSFPALRAAIREQAAR